MKLSVPILFAFAAFTFWDTNSSQGAIIVEASNAAVQQGLSPYNWVVQDGIVSSSGGGSSFTLKFTGTSNVSLQINTSALAKMEASRYPMVGWTVDGGPRQIHQILPGEKSIRLAADSPDPTIDFYLMGFSPFEDRYTGNNPLNSVCITGFQLDDGGTVAAMPETRKHWLNIGDSIMSGDAAREQSQQGRPPNGAWASSSDARVSYGYLLAQHYGFAESRLAYGGYDYRGGLAKIPPLSTLIDQITSRVTRLKNEKLLPAPDVVLINLGENGAPGQISVTDALGKIRLRAGSATKIIVMIPVSGKARAEVTQAFNAYRDAQHDPAVYLVDLGKIQYPTADRTHPTAAGHQTIYEAALPFFDKILQ